jgi:hypothetical protein
MTDGDRAGRDRTPLSGRSAKQAAVAALASGVLAALGAFALVLFGIIEAAGGTPTGATEPSPFVRASDALGGLAMLAAIPVAFRLHAAWGERTALVGGATLAIALASLTGYAAVVLAYAAGIDAPTVEGMLAVLGIGGIGLWILLVSLNRTDPALHGGLRSLGIAIGLGNLALFVAYFMTDRVAAITEQHFGPVSVLLAVAYAAGAISSQFGYPIWAIWVGRRWVSGTRVDVLPGVMH